MIRPQHNANAERVVWSVVVACFVMCSQAQASGLKEWERYKGYAGTRGLHLKPFVVVFDRHGVIVNQQRTTAATAYRLLKKSQNLSPMPDILVRADHDRLVAARRFMRRVSDAGMCEERKCFYRFSR